jgi:hypothetical protein
MNLEDLNLVELNAQEAQEVQGGGWFRNAYKEVVHELHKLRDQLEDFIKGGGGQIYS